MHNHQGSSIKDYKFGQKIGEGSYAKVYLGLHNHTKEIVAIKQIKKPPQEQISKIDQEIAVLMSLDNQNIIKLLNTDQTESHIYLIQEYCSLKDLEEFMKDHFSQGFPEDLAQIFFQQICYALLEMGSKEIIHRDLKLSNILLNSNYNLKVADFGFAKYQEHEKRLQQSAVGTPLTMALEVLLGQQYDQKCDIWSCGVILYQMVFGKYPFQPQMGQGITSLISLIQQSRGTGVSFPERIQVSDNLKDLISRMLKVDQQNRMSLDELLNHPWIDSKMKTDYTQIKQKYDKYFRNAESVVDTTYALNLGTSMRNYVDSQTKIMLGDINDIIENIRKIGEKHSTCQQSKQDLFQQFVFLLSMYKDVYTFRLNDQNIVKLPKNSRKLIEQFISEKLNLDVIVMDDEIDELQNKSGLSGISSQITRHLLIFIEQQYNDYITVDDKVLFKQISIKLLQILMNQQGSFFGFFKSMNLINSDRRLFNVNVKTAYLAYSEQDFQHEKVLDYYQDQDNSSISNQNNYNSEQQIEEEHKQEIQESSKLNDQKYQKNILEQYQRHNNEEQVEQIEIDESDLFEEEDFGGYMDDPEKQLDKEGVMNDLRKDFQSQQIEFQLKNYIYPLHDAEEQQNLQFLQTILQEDHSI